MAIISYPFAAGEALTRVIESGSGDRAVIFIHGLGARADRWAANLEAVAAAGHHCYALDLPGHGFAGKSTDYDYGVPAFAGFVKDFADAAGIDRAALIGTSLGGHVCGMFACDNPDRVTAVALVGSVGIIPIGPEASNIVRDNVKNTTREGIAGKLQLVFAKKSIISEALIDEEFRINNSPGAVAAFDRLGDYIAERIDDDNVGDRLADLAASKPMLLIWGEEDAAVPLAIGLKASEKIAGAELVRIPGAGHVSYIEAPHLFNRTIIEFLDGAGA